MLVQHVKEPMDKGSINCICKIRYENSAFQSAKNLNFENLSPSTNMVGPMMDSGDERMSSTFSVNSP